MKRKTITLKTLILVLLLTGLMVNVSPGEELKKESKESKEKKELGEWLEQIKTHSLSDLQPGPNHKQIALTVSEPTKDNKRKTNIWILNLETEKIRRYTTSKKGESQPRWSPDGETLAFLSNRDGKRQIYLLPMAGGEAQALTESKTGVQSYKWSPDGKSIAFLSPDPKPEDEEKKEKEKDDGIVADAGKRNALLRKIDVNTKKVQTLTQNKWRIDEFVWAPTGDRMFLSATDNPHEEYQTHKIYEMSAKDGKLKLTATPKGPFYSLALSPDGKTLAYIGCRTDGPIPTDIFFLPVSGGAAENITGKSIDRVISRFKWQKDGGIIAQAQTGFDNTLYHIYKNGNVKKIKPFKVIPSGDFVYVSGKFYFIGQTALTPPELWVSKGLGSTRRVVGPAGKLTGFNKKWDAKAYIEPAIVRYTSFDKTEIEAALYKPKDYKKGTRIPAVIVVHGGPAGRFSYRFSTWAQLLADRGFAVLCPNIRGSIGYGYDFIAMNRYDWGGGDFKDVMAGADYLIHEGIADPDGLGIGGWSYGGYMSAWAVTQTHRFKASVSGAPMTDLAFEYGAEMAAINAYDTWYLGTPYENLDNIIKMSPMTWVKNVKTPTLILCGENDPIDPIGQCKQFYRGLKRYGVDTQFVTYPREGHGIREKKHRIDVHYRMMFWFLDRLKKQ
jgi:dipeptidyl aminopeptidase/acylaminoacyl peptidase